MKKQIIALVSGLLLASTAFAQTLEEKYPDLSYEQAHAYELYLTSHQETLDAEQRSNDYTDVRKSEAIKVSNKYTDDKLHQTGQYFGDQLVSTSSSGIAYTDNQVGALRGDVQKWMRTSEKKMSAGISGVAAMSNIPYVDGDTFSVGVGGGWYNGENAVAVGAQNKPTRSTAVRLSFSHNSEQDHAIGAGFAVGF